MGRLPTACRSLSTPSSLCLPVPFSALSDHSFLLLILYVWCFAHLCISMHYVWYPQRASNPLELKLQMVVDTWNEIWVLRKSSQCFKLLSRLSRPSIFIFLWKNSILMLIHCMAIFCTSVIMELFKNPALYSWGGVHL